MKDDVDYMYREFSRLGEVKILWGVTMRSRLLFVERGKERIMLCVCVLIKKQIMTTNLFLVDDILV